MIRKNIFTERITEAIKQSGMTQKQIAKKLNVSEGNITNWKKGENYPSIEILYNLCILLNESADYLIGLEDESGAKKYTNNSFRFYDNSTGNIKF